MTDAFPPSIGGYLPERLLGRGAVAAVFLCRDASGEPVAVKWMDDPHPPLVRRFEREVAALERLQHPGIVRYHSHGEEGGRPFLVMEYIDGVDLRVYTRKLLGRPAAERYARARTLGRALSEALAHIHAQDLVHRDLKPSNVLVAEDGRVVLTDFGVVKDLRASDRTIAGLMVGTYGYAAPEQVRDEPVDARTDLFGLGATLYFMLTGVRPFDGPDRGELGWPAPPSHHDPGLPADIEAVVLRLMAPSPVERYADAQAAAEALAAGRQEGIPLAGRGDAVAAVSDALGRAAQGRGVVLAVRGPAGVGRRWVVQMARGGARRRGLPLLVVEEEEQLAPALARLPANRPGVLVVTTELSHALSHERVELVLKPLGLADVRRTVYAAAPLTADAAQVAMRLHRLTGGLPGLLVPMLRRYRSGAAIVLPDAPRFPLDLDEYLDAVELDEHEVLELLALSPLPLSEALIEAVVPVPAAPALEELLRRGLVRRSGSRWRVSAELFAEALRERVADPEGLRARLKAAQSRAEESGQDDPRLQAVVAQVSAESAAGRPGPALDAAQRATDLAQAVGDRALECEALCQLGQVLLDLGRARDARLRLADATALARAVDLPRVRRLTHVLRACAELAERPGERTAALAAIDRLMPLTAGAANREASFADAMAFATWSIAAAVLGDATTRARTDAQAERRLPGLPEDERMRVQLTLATAAAASGEVAAAQARLDRVRAAAAPESLLAWQAQRLTALLKGQPVPSPGALAEGLEPEHLASMVGQRIHLGRAGAG